MLDDWKPLSILNHITYINMLQEVGISRVVYDISSKPPATIEWE